MLVLRCTILLICVLHGLGCFAFAQQNVPIVSLSVPDAGQPNGPRNGAVKIGTNGLLLEELPVTITPRGTALQAGSIRISRSAIGNLGRLVIGYTLQYSSATNANLTTNTGFVRFNQAGLSALPNLGTMVRQLPNTPPTNIITTPPLPGPIPVAINGFQGDLSPVFSNRAFNVSSEAQPGTISLDSGVTSAFINFTARHSDQSYCCNPGLQGPRLAILRIFPLPNENPPSFQVQSGADSAFVVLNDPPNVPPVIMNRIPDIYVTRPTSLNPLSGAIDLESPRWRNDNRPGPIFYDDNYDPLTYTIQSSDVTVVNALVSTNNPAVEGRTALLYSVLPGAPAGRAIAISVRADDRRTERLPVSSFTNFTITPLASIPTTVALSNDIQSVIISPNPVSTSIQIHGKAELTGVVTVRLINAAGVEVLAERLTVSEGAAYSRIVDIRHLSAGMYIVEVEEGSHKTARKLLKQ